MQERSDKGIVLIPPTARCFLDSDCLELAPAKPEIEQKIKQALEQGSQLQPIEVLDGEVGDIFYPMWAYPVGGNDKEKRWAKIIFQKPEAPFGMLGVLVPIRALEELDADFFLAKMRYYTYTLNGQFFAIIQYIGPSVEELLKQPFESVISDEVVEELDRLFAE